MPKRCVAAGCSNTSQDGFSLHKFPKDPQLRRIWTSKVKLTRTKWPGPSKYAVLCSAHFDDTCFDEEHRGLYSSFGLKRAAKLRPDAVPSKFTLKKKTEQVTKTRKCVFEERKKQGEYAADQRYFLRKVTRLRAYGGTLHVHVRVYIP